MEKIWRNKSHEGCPDFYNLSVCRDPKQNRCSCYDGPKIVLFLLVCTLPDVSTPLNQHDEAAASVDLVHVMKSPEIQLEIKAPRSNMTHFQLKILKSSFHQYVSVQHLLLLPSLTTEISQMAVEPEGFSIGYAGCSYDRNIEKPRLRDYPKASKSVPFDYIDCVKPDSNSKSIDLRVIGDFIIIFTTISSTPSSTNYSFDSCIDYFLWSALKHQKSLLDELSVIKKLYFYDELKDVRTFEKMFDRLINVLESRDRLLQVKSLMISVHGQDQLMQLLNHIDLKVLKRLEVYRLLEIEKLSDNGDDNSEFVLDLDILKECENLEKLDVKSFSISSSFRMFTHIPNLEVNMQTIYCEDLLLFKQTMLNSDINAHSEIRFEQFPDKSRFMENIGLVDDGSESFHVFPSKLFLTYWPASKCMKFNWKHIAVKGPDYLSKMPSTVMLEILKHCDYWKIHALRNTCHYLRDFIDDVQPDATIDSMKISVDKDSIYLNFETGSFVVKYQKSQSIIWKKKRQDYGEKFFQDLNYILRHPMLTVNDFSVTLSCAGSNTASKFYSDLEALLKSRVQPLSVQKLTLQVFFEEDVMSVLPYFEAGKLEAITIHRALLSGLNLSLDRIIETDQFKKAKEIEIPQFMVDVQMHHFCHFEKVRLHFLTIRLSDILMIKQKFFDSKTAQFFQVDFEKFPEISRLVEALGPPHMMPRRNCLKLRKVCHAFRDYIDCVKPDSNLKAINLEVRADMITVLLSTPSSTKDDEFLYKEHELLCLMQRGPRYAMFENNCVDLCVDDFLWPALKHQKSLLDELYVTRQLEFDENNQSIPQTPGKLLVPTFEKLFDSLINVLESRDRLLKVENLMISLTGKDQLMRLLRHVDLKALKRLQLIRLSETETYMDYRQDNSEYPLDLDILKDCKNLEELDVRRFSISSPLRMLAHIPNLKVNMQTISCEDLLLFKQNLENLNTFALSIIQFVQFPDKSRFMETIGLADDGSDSLHVFPSKLYLAYKPGLKRLKFNWKYT
ncbi:hypothetical protein GCK72_021426 [Caenorhabditis remanei]|uniref:F-box domain-containing protein n=1 Tax=Caenorhabditis remanei TaxID=31234 RepID=A0A6A5GJS4_CAERE|nr:hypothetical protein GCK72_021426 [Caenorhabditis remanei]KAF1754861.1 hypothetical protein GCK72_021426 [Caenorhabditis remanei]